MLGPLSVLQFALAFLVGVATLLGIIVGAVKWIVSLQGRQDTDKAVLKGQQDADRSRQESHEKLCEERYRQISENFAKLVKVSDERHEENASWRERVEDKLDRLIEAR